MRGPATGERVGIDAVRPDMGRQPDFGMYLAVAMTILPISFEADAGGTAGGERCLRTIDIDRLHIVDDNRLAFRMRGGQWYVNEFPRRCHALSPQATIAYESSIGRLCSVDFVSVLRSFGGRLTRVGTCGLGAFEPVGDHEAERMLEQS